MTVRKFCGLLHDAKLGKNDKKWFPKWIRRYASAINVAEGNLSVTEDGVIRFSRSLRDNGTPAWQRLQAVRAVEAYRNLVIGSDEPSLVEIRRTLGRLADQERAFGVYPQTGDIPSARRGSNSTSSLLGKLTSLSGRNTRSVPRLKLGPTFIRHSVPGLSGRIGYHAGSSSSPQRTANRLPSRSQVTRTGVPDDSGSEFAMKSPGGLTSGFTAFL